MKLTLPYQSVLPPLSALESESLRASVDQEGVRDRLVATEDGRLLDGYNRLRLRPGAPVAAIPGSADWSDAECIAWILRNADGRRNLSPDQKREILDHKRRVAANLREQDAKRFTQQALAVMLGVNQATVSRWLNDTTNMHVHNGCIPLPDARVKVPVVAHSVIYQRHKDGEAEAQIAADYGVVQQTVAKIIEHQKDEEEQQKPTRWTDREKELRRRLEAGESVVVNVDADHRVIEWAQQRSLFVLVNRQTQWGNPFRIDDDGDRPTVIRKYVDHYLPHKDRLNREIASLQGRALGCHCAPLACHGDILAELANRELTHD